MKRNIKALNITLAPDIYNYLDKKLEHLEKILSAESGTAVAHIEIGKWTKHHQTGDWYKGKMQLHLVGKEFVAEVEAGSVYAAIDLLKDEMAQELSTYKDKRLTFVKRGGRAVKELLQRKKKVSLPR